MCSFDLEAHLVHESHDGKYAVVGIMYTIGRPDSFLASVSNTTPIYLLSVLLLNNNNKTGEYSISEHLFK